MAARIKVCEFDLKELSIFLSRNMDNPAVLVLMDTGKNAFSVSSVWRDMVTPYVMIMYAWSSPKYPELSSMEMAIIKRWAKTMGMSVIRAVVRKNIKAWEKKYGFKQDGYLVKLEV